MRSSILAMGSCLALCACNAVLGMERARLDDGDAGVVGAGGAPPGAGGATVITPRGTGGGPAQVSQNYTDCTSDSAECASCITTNPGCDTSKCMADKQCRVALLNYTRCLDSSLCGDKSCSEKLTNVLENNPLLPHSCIEACPACTPSRGVLPICKLYCSCMQVACADQLQSALGGSLDACVAQCEMSGDAPSITLCKETHCEAAAQYDPDVHCQHAIGKLGQCMTEIKVCTVGLSTGFAGCQTGSDCCSGICTGHVCTDT
jgi:hypothetical protein